MSGMRWFKFDSSDWLHGTAMLNLEEIGAYIQIIALLYESENALEIERISHPVTGKLVGYSYKRLARILNTRSDKLKRLIDGLVLQNKLSIQAGYLTNNRVGKELIAAAKRKQKGTKMARERWDNVIGFKPVDNFPKPR